MTDHEHEWHTLTTEGSGLLSNHFFQCRKCPERLMFPDALAILNEHADLLEALKAIRAVATTHTKDTINLLWISEKADTAIKKAKS